MGTRSLTFVYDDGEAIVNLYRQYDGYPSCHGAELSAFINSKRLTNGIATPSEGTANGMGCLAAQMVAHFKVEVGNFYLVPPVLGYDAGQDYEYHVHEDKVRVRSYGEALFEGTWEEFAVFCAEKEG